MLAQVLKEKEKEIAIITEPEKPSSERRKSEVIIPKGCLRCSGRLLSGLTEGLKNMYAEVRFAAPADGSVVQEALRDIGQKYLLEPVLQPGIGYGALKTAKARDTLARCLEGYNILGYVSPYSNRNVMVIGPDSRPVSSGWSYKRIEVLHNPWPELKQGVSYSTFGVDNYIAGTILRISDEIAHRVDCKMDGR